MTAWLGEIPCPNCRHWQFPMTYCPKCGHKWQFVDLDAIEAAESDGLLPCPPLSTQFVRLGFTDAGPGQPRGNFEVVV